MAPIIEIKDLHAAYGKKQVLNGFSLNIAQNKITAILGPSGCGKTTLLHCLNGSIRSEAGASVSGHICLHGTDTAALHSEQLHRQIGIVFQTPTPFPFSIYKNMTYCAKYNGIRNPQELRRIAEEKLTMAGLWDEVKDDLSENAMHLSGGQQQRLCIARALTAEPEVLLLDEPCSALDAASTAAIEEMLLSLKSKYTIVIVTHNIAQARRICDYAALMDQGQLIEYAERDAFFRHPQEERTKAFLGGMYG